MKILSVGSMNGLSNTCVHRHWALEKVANCVDTVNMYETPVSLWFKIANRLFSYGLPLRLPDNSNANQNIKKYIEQNDYDIVWIDKGWVINKKTLEFIKKKNSKTKIVSYSPDNMILRHNQSQNYLECIPFYDFIFTNKSYILEGMKKLGAKNIQFVNNSYQGTFHFPRELTPLEYEKLGGDVGFVGVWEEERCASILHLAKGGINIRVFGGGKWINYKNIYPNLIIEDEGLYGEEYSKSFKAFKISLCFLRKMNYDLQTTRTMEIPACGGFMLAERTLEHCQLFEEDLEAVFFSDNEELLQKCKFYLRNDNERQKIAERGLLRCQVSGYSNEETIKKIISEII